MSTQTRELNDLETLQERYEDALMAGDIEAAEKVEEKAAFLGYELDDRVLLVDMPEDDPYQEVIMSNLSVGILSNDIRY